MTGYKVDPPESAEHFLAGVRGSECSGCWACDRCGGRFEGRRGATGPYGLERAPARVFCASCVRLVLRGASVLTVEEELESLGVEMPRRGVGPGGSGS